MRERRDGSWVARTARLAPDASLQAPSVLGERVEVGRRARVGPLTVVGDDSRIGDDARIQGAILWEDVRVGPGAILRDCVVPSNVTIGAHAEVAPGVTLDPNTVIPPHAKVEARG